LRYIHVNIDELSICVVSPLSPLGVSVFSVVIAGDFDCCCLGAPLHTFLGMCHSPLCVICTFSPFHSQLIFDCYFTKQCDITTHCTVWLNSM